MTHTFFLAAGGTGGHIFPALSLAESLQAKGHTVIFVTDKRFGNYITNHNASLQCAFIQSGTLQGTMLQKIVALGKMGVGFFQARGLIKTHRPEAVIGFGGYPSFPTMFAAIKSHVPTILHEQNAILGRTNRFLARYVTCIATSFPDLQPLSMDDQKRSVTVGTPVRAAIKAIRDVPYPTLETNGVLRVLVIGGSQGARIFSEVIPEALTLLPVHLRNRIRIDQQCRPDDLEQVRKHYQSLQVSADIATFFTDIPARLASAHLVISRAGASTLAELTVAGRPSLLIPYPHATDNHQQANANHIESAQAGWVIPQHLFTPHHVANRLESFLTQPESLRVTAANAKERGMVDSVEKLVELVEGVSR